MLPSAMFPLCSLSGIHLLLDFSDEMTCATLQFAPETLECPYKRDILDIVSEIRSHCPKTTLNFRFGLLTK